MLNFFQKFPKYWLFQALGWGLFLAVNVFFAISYKIVDQVFAVRLTVTILLGVLFTHLMRMVIKQLKFLQKTINFQLIGFVLLSAVFALTIGLVETIIVNGFDLRFKQENSFNFFQDYISNAFTWMIFLFIWNCIYFIYHFIDESTRNQLDKLKLEALVKSLELKTIKSHINPHFIFNALNSIRALIDENPSHARDAVTALSNILRSSMVSETQETISLERELLIVKDYLALELIRFEERLSIRYEIPSEVLHHQIPPMMLQTLVENAIKHGISKSLKPGEILIKASFIDNDLTIEVLNTGNLNEHEYVEGFGIQSTSSRLNLIFGAKSSFNICQIDSEHVQAKVLIPLS
ncbi:MAG: sensor histidine kinase [Chitinophagaceae bacterium]